MQLLDLCIIVIGYTTLTAKGQSSKGNQAGFPDTLIDYDLTALLTDSFPGTTNVGFSPVPTVDNKPATDQTDFNTVTQKEEQKTTDTHPECECVPYYLCSENRTMIENGEGIINIRMNNSCGDYLSTCCPIGKITDPNDPITSPPVIGPRSDICGQRNFNGVSLLRISGADNNEAQFGEFPWMIAVTSKDNETRVTVYQCGGSLIHPQVVLTAARCVKGKENLRVRAGEWDTQRKTEPLPTQSRLVRNVVIHEEYYRGALFNDIALLFLESALDIAPNVATICLPQQGENMDQRSCVASGWGKDTYGKEGAYQVILKKVDLPIVPRDTCLAALRTTLLGSNFKLHSSFICAGGIPGHDTCTGDGGSPLVCPTKESPGIYVQAGIVAWGIRCNTDIPGVYVDVSQFRNWIDSKLNLYNMEAV